MQRRLGGRLKPLMTGVVLVPLVPFLLVNIGLVLRW
jgi:hypothetical protein